MKTKIYARLFLVIFITQFLLSCANKNEQANASEDLLNSLSERFAKNNYVNPANVALENPYENVGDKSKLLAYNFERNLPFTTKARDFNSQIGQYTPYKLMGLESKEFVKMTKAISRKVYTEQDENFPESRFDQLNERLLKYNLDSEGVTSLLNDTEKSSGISPLQRRIIEIQLQEMATAKTNAQAIAICATVEYEVTRSKIDGREMNKILFVNSITRNSFENDFPEHKTYGYNYLSTEPFHKVTVGMSVMVVVFLASVVIAAFNCDPADFSCNSSIAAANLMGAVFGVAYDSYTANGVPCGSEYPCNRND